VGEQGLARGVPPSRAPDPTRVPVGSSAARHELLHAKFNRRCGLLNILIGRRLVPPVTRVAVGDVANRSTVA
jgi:hypothetical protein